MVQDIHLLSVNAAFPKDIHQMLSLIQKSGKKLDAVFLGIDVHNYSAEPEAVAYPYPEYLYDNNLLNDSSYIFIKDIIPYIETMPTTQFVIFFPPYSILYWYNHMAEGDIEALIYQTEYITQRLLQYPNVKVFQFQNDYDYITNYDNYCDYTHYRHEMNDYMTVCFANGENEITLENYKVVLNDMKEWLLAFDYENCW